MPDSALAVGSGWLPPPKEPATIDEQLDELTEGAPEELIRAWLVWYQDDPERPGDHLSQTRHSRAVNLIPRLVLRLFGRAPSNYRDLASFIRGPVATGGLNLGLLVPPDVHEQKRRDEYDRERGRVGYPPIKRDTPSCSPRTWSRLTEMCRPIVDWREEQRREGRL